VTASGVIGEGQLLLAVSFLLGVVQVQDNHLRGLSITGHKVLDKRLREAVDILAGSRVLQVREGRGAGPIGAGSSGARSSPRLKTGSPRRALASLPSSSPEAT
jgi:hypothetical protein